MKRTVFGTTDERRISDLVACGDYDKAVPLAQALLRNKPDHPVGIKALASGHIYKGRFDEALTLLRRGARLFPGDPEMHSNLGVVLSNKGQYREAIEAFDAAISIEPACADYYSNKALAQYYLGDMSTALTNCREAIERDPDNAEAYSTFGLLYDRLRQPESALQAFKKAAELNPEAMSCFLNVVITLEGMRRYREAAECGRQVLEGGELTDDEFDLLFPRVCSTERAICDWRGGDISPSLEQVISRFHISRLEPFFLLHVENIDRTTLRKGAEVFARTYFHAHSLTSGGNFAIQETELPARRKLRVGFMSADFREHPIGQLAVGVFENFDRDRFELFAYTYGPRGDSPLTRRLNAAFDVVRDLDALSFPDAARAIKDDAIDILVDMSGWTKHTRLATLGYQPAPVVASWLAFPGTLGLGDRVHYLISDPIISPLEHANDYSEKLALMPFCYQPNSRNPSESLVQPGRKENDLPDKAFVLASFNQSIKITPDIFRLWCEILLRHPSTVLWLGVQDADAQHNLLQEAATFGVLPGRIIFAGWTERPEDHQARLSLADLALDTFPFGSHTTGTDMLWSGVPLVARKGSTFASRVSASLLEAVGLPELIAESNEDYFSLISALIDDPARYQSIRRRLQGAREKSPLFDTRRFSRDLGRLFQAMWSNYLSGKHSAIRLAPIEGNIGTPGA